MSGCPTADVLEHFINGRLGVDEGPSVEAHVGACSACQRILEELTPSLGNPSGSDWQGGTALEPSALDRLKGRRPLVCDEPAGPPDASSLAPLYTKDDSRSTRASGRDPATPPIPTGPLAITGFEILREIGRGGMGIVYEAIELALGRRVALKVLPPLSASPTTAERFRREARAAGRLHHTNIVPIFGVGSDGDLLYYAMQFIEGEGLDRLIDRLRRERSIPARSRLRTEVDRTRAAPPEPDRMPAGPPSAPRPAEGGRLTPSSGVSSLARARTVARIGLQIAEALDYAHKCGFLHRDIKPSNILIDRAGTAWVADFGLAKSAEPEEALTHTGDIVGTLRYMPPERFDGRSDARGDVYALGATLYELLTLRPIFDDSDRTRLIERVLGTEPVPPRQLDHRVPRDLETIVLKAMGKESSRRYATAGLMAEDIRCFLDERPIRARPPNLLDRLFKWTRRRPAMAALSAMLLAVLLVAFVAITILWVDATKARDRATASAALARQQGEVERRTRYQAGISAAASALELDHPDDARSLLENLPEEHRNWEWRYLAGQLDNSTLVFRPQEGPVKAFDLAPDGKSFAYALDGSSELRLRSTVDRRDFARFDGLASAITTAVFSPDGTRVAAGSTDGTIRVWGVEGGAPVAVLERQESAVRSIEFDHTASRVLFVNDRLEANVWDLANGRRLALGGAWGAHFSPDGRSIFCVSGSEVKFLNSVDGRPFSLPDAGDGALEAAAFSPDSSRIATGGFFPATDIVIHPFTVAGKTIALKGHVNSISSLDFSPDGRRLASGSLDQTARIWDATTGSNLAVLHGHRAKVSEVQFASGGRRLLTRSEDGAIRLWATSDGALLGSLRGQAGSSAMRLSRDGPLVGVVDERGTMRIWDLDRTVRRGVLAGHTSFVYDVAIGADGRWVGSASWDETVRFWDQGAGGQSIRSRRLGGIVRSVAASPVGHRFATVGKGSVLLLWEPPGTEPLWSATFDTGQGPDSDGRVAFHPSGGILALAGERKWSVRFYDTATGEPLGGLQGHDRTTTDVAFSPDGETIATADIGGTLQLWDFTSRESRAVIKAHDGYISRLAFHPGGTMLASASFDGSVRFWETASGRLLAILKDASPVFGLAFNPDGTRLATACRDNTIRLWDTRHYEKVAELRGHQAYVHAVAFNPDGTRLISGSGDFTVRIWDAPKSAGLLDSILDDPGGVMRPAPNTAPTGMRPDRAP